MLSLRTKKQPMQKNVEKHININLAVSSEGHQTTTVHIYSHKSLKSHTHLFVFVSR
jgi:hypothetical protein